MKFLKPHHEDGYLMVIGSGRTMVFTEDQLKAFSMAYDELRFVNPEHRRSFSLTEEPIDKLLSGISQRRKEARELYDE
jgi:hypothetical protein